MKHTNLALIGLGDFRNNPGWVTHTNNDCGSCMVIVLDDMNVVKA